MVQKIFSQLNSINNYSKNIIKYGSIFSIIMCLAGISVVEYNSIVTNKISIYNIGSTMIYTSIVVFSQVIIASLLIDFFGNYLSNHE